MSTHAKRRSGESVTNPAGYLATQDLRERGWNARLIAQFLGEHDLTRPNGLRMGRRKLPPVKLYLESRVELAENDEDFLLLMQRAQDRREKAQQRREEKQRERAEQIESFVSGYHPRVKALNIRKGAVRQARAPHLAALETTLQGITTTLKLSAAEEKTVRQLLTERLDDALRQVYEWFAQPKQAKKAIKTVKPSASSQAQPADWQNWDWD